MHVQFTFNLRIYACHHQFLHFSTHRCTCADLVRCHSGPLAWYEGGGSRNCTLNCRITRASSTNAESELELTGRFAGAEADGRISGEIVDSALLAEEVGSPSAYPLLLLPMYLEDVRSSRRRIIRGPGGYGSTSCTLLCSTACRRYRMRLTNKIVLMPKHTIPAIVPRTTPTIDPPDNDFDACTDVVGGLDVGDAGVGAPVELNDMHGSSNPNTGQLH